MSAAAERLALIEYYGKSSQFAKRLKTMSDAQVIAIHKRLKAKGAIK